MRIIGVMIALSLICGCKHIKPSSSATNSSIEWRLNIDQPLRQAEECLDEAKELGQQQGMNYAISNLSFLLEIKLYLLFERYAASLSPVARIKAIKGQTEWMVAHRKAVSVAYEEYAGGSFSSYSAGLVAVESYRERIAEIESLAE